MKTAVDSSVLLDVLTGDPEFGEPSRNALQSAYDRGALIACEVVWAEVRAHFDEDRLFHEVCASIGLTFDPLSARAAATAGHLWRAYCLSHRRPRSRVVADFLIGSHALTQADRLLARDRGFYRESFDGLTLVDPCG